jgi:hypothetical protein
MEDVGKLYGYLIDFIAIWYILRQSVKFYGYLVYFSHLGMLWQEKSGNPAHFLVRAEGKKTGRDFLLFAPYSENWAPLLEPNKEKVLWQLYMQREHLVSERVCALKPEMHLMGVKIKRTNKPFPHYYDMQVQNRALSEVTKQAS